MIDPGSILSTTRFIDARDEIVGFYLDANFNLHGFYSYNGQFASIDIPNSTETRAEGINDLGLISGEYVGLDSIEHGFLLQEGNVRVSMCPSHSRPMFGWSLTIVHSRATILMTPQFPDF